jgi:hypothetical protein
VRNSEGKDRLLNRTDEKMAACRNRVLIEEWNKDYASPPISNRGSSSSVDRRSWSSVILVSTCSKSRCATSRSKLFLPLSCRIERYCCLRCSNSRSLSLASIAVKHTSPGMKTKACLRSPGLGQELLERWFSRPRAILRFTRPV